MASGDVVMRKVPSSSARVDFVTSNNQTFNDAIQFDPPVSGVTGPAWSLTGQAFRMDIAPNFEQSALLTLTSAANEIVTDDVTERIVHFNVPESVIQAALIPGDYVYDFIMFDASVPSIRVQLMHGKFTVSEGITGG
jgi:hypothetical protein